MDNIDAILYINLEHRTDRKQHILKEIHKICTNTSKIHRIDAIKIDPGALGCGLSHIKALEYVLSHPEWNTVLILEDDFTFKSDNSRKLLNNIDMILRDTNNMDMAILSYNTYNFKSTDTPNVRIKKIQYSQTTSSYIIKRHYIPKLITIFTESTDDIKKNGKKHENCIDIYWTRFQASDNWFAISPPIGYQYDSFSDIENRFVRYGC